MAGRVREISDDEGSRLRRIAHPRYRTGGDVAAGADGGRPAQGMSVAQITGLAFTSEDRAWDARHNVNAGGARRGLGCARPAPARLIPPFRRSETRKGD